MNSGKLIVAMLILGTIQSADLATIQTEKSFEVVSIRRNLGGSATSISTRPDGGISMVNVIVRTLITQAYGVAPADISGLPNWATSERYDVSATVEASGNTSPADRPMMMRSMLLSRFKLAAHYERREAQSFDLVVARADRGFGPGLRVSAIDCEAVAAAERASAEAAQLAGLSPAPPAPVSASGAVPACTLRIGGNRAEGDTTMTNFALLLRSITGRPIVDKTNLSGFFRISMEFDGLQSVRPGGAPAASAELPSVFTALQEQLGLKLEPSRTFVEVLVIDNLERPTEN